MENKEEIYIKMWGYLKEIFIRLNDVNPELSKAYLNIIEHHESLDILFLDRWIKLKHRNSVILKDEKLKSFHSIIKTIIEAMNKFEKANGIKKAK